MKPILRFSQTSSPQAGMDWNSLVSARAKALQCLALALSV